MTDKVIIKALKEILDLINQQKADIKELKKGINIELDNFASEYDEKIKAEAVKEFAEILKNKKRKGFDYDEAGYCRPVFIVTVDDIDNIAKETVGDE